MKRIISVLMVLSMIICLSACGAKTQVDKDAFKCCLICLHDENATYDKNFIEGFKEACEKAGLVEGETYFITTNVPEGAECLDAARDAVDMGCSLVISDSYGHQDYMIEAAKEFPDVEFTSCTGDKANTIKMDNFHNAFASIYEGRYIAGVVAGYKLQSMIDAGELDRNNVKVGYVGAYPYAEVISGYTSWFLGVRSCCPTATMEVVYTNSWYDETLEREAAVRLITNGCVLLSQHADSYGAPSACEEAGIINVSYNGSTLKQCPNTFLISSRINWEPYFSHAIDCVMNNKELEIDWCGTIDTGSVELTEFNEKIAAPDTDDYIDLLYNDLSTGINHVFDTCCFTIDGQLVESLKADVEVDDAFTPDTEAVADGYFHESEFRSAPYFAFQIDGITILN